MLYWSATYVNNANQIINKIEEGKNARAPEKSKRAEQQTKKFEAFQSLWCKNSRAKVALFHMF